MGELEKGKHAFCVSFKAQCYSRGHNNNNNKHAIKRCIKNHKKSLHTLQNDTKDLLKGAD